MERCYSYCTCYSPYFFYVQNTYTQTVEQKLYSQNLELNHQLATLKEKNAGLESKLNSEESITDEKNQTILNIKIEEKFPDPGFFSSFLFIQSFN